VCAGFSWLRIGTSPRILRKTLFHGFSKSKGNVVHVLYFNRAPRHEGLLGELRYGSTHSLTSALDRR
jgi:hypothetical protein